MSPADTLRDMDAACALLDCEPGELRDVVQTGADAARALAYRLGLIEAHLGAVLNAGRDMARSLRALHFEKPPALRAWDAVAGDAVAALTDEEWA